MYLGLNLGPEIFEPVLTTGLKEFMMENISVQPEPKVSWIAFASVHICVSVQWYMHVYVHVHMYM